MIRRLNLIHDPVPIRTYTHLSMEDLVMAFDILCLQEKLASVSKVLQNVATELRFFAKP